MNEENSTDRLQLDTSVPASMAHFMEVRSTAMLQHGGVCTRLNFSRVEAMDLKEFLASEVPKLRQDTGDLFAVRDSAGGRFLFILGDQVVKYTLTSMQEAPMKAMAELLRREEDEVLTPDIPYPIIMQRRNQAGMYLVIKVPSCRRVLRQRLGRFGASSGVVEGVYYPPPVWFGMKLNTAGTVLEAKVAVESEQSLHWNTTVLRAWPLPNVHASCQICQGSTTTQLPDGYKPCLQEVIQYTLQRFFESEYNFDLLRSDRELERLIGWKYKADKAPEGLVKAIAQASGSRQHALVLKLEAVLSEPDAWSTLDWSAMATVSAEEFCR